MEDWTGHDRHKPGETEPNPRPAETEVPAGPGDAGASDVPEPLKHSPEQHPARAKHGRTLIRIFWAVAIFIVLVVLIQQ